MNPEIVILAYKKGNVIYQYRDGRFMMARLIGTEIINYKQLELNHWELDKLVSRNGYTEMTGVLIDPIENKVFLLESEMSNSTTTQNMLEKRLLELMQ